MYGWTENLVSTTGYVETAKLHFNILLYNHVNPEKLLNQRIFGLFWFEGCQNILKYVIVPHFHRDKILTYDLKACFNCIIFF